MEGKENKMESRRNSKEGGSGGEKSTGERGKDKDRGKVVETGRGGGSVERGRRVGERREIRGKGSEGF